MQEYLIGLLRASMSLLSGQSNIFLPFFYFYARLFITRIIFFLFGLFLLHVRFYYFTFTFFLQNHFIKINMLRLTTTTKTTAMMMMMMMTMTMVNYDAHLDHYHFTNFITQCSPFTYYYQPFFYNNRKDKKKLSHALALNFIFLLIVTMKNETPYGKSRI